MYTTAACTGYNPLDATSPTRLPSNGPAGANSPRANPAPQDHPPAPQTACAFTWPRVHHHKHHSETASQATGRAHVPLHHHQHLCCRPDDSTSWLLSTGRSRAAVAV
ncbi:hypothetical protein BDY17DRAFT_290686 [Neohortaea acidophila]|uniref:Uncharacterized protein n=1 Tax=Neohortaea acidophila TaxID=245834 RepID=A0A6A6Q0R8_9PEZI|nr:uncharacterized protein BDY17DRAFT_290686 [Neohortaea acidophila]KAF2486000.1 hypothetical protein BDY17DRAFT_290686 [Neohortaea acidophila]